MTTGVRLTQKSLVFGVYWGAKKSANAGLNIWFRDRYVWPIQRKAVPPRTPRKDPRLRELPFEQQAETESPAKTG